jgi:hypothetical protein
MLALGGNEFLIRVEERLAEDLSSPATQRE